MNVLNTTEFYTLKWLLSCYVNFTSIKPLCVYHSLQGPQHLVPVIFPLSLPHLPPLRMCTHTGTHPCAHEHIVTFPVRHTCAHVHTQLWTPRLLASPQTSQVCSISASLHLLFLHLAHNSHHCIQGLFPLFFLVLLQCSTSERPSLTTQNKIILFPISLTLYVFLYSFIIWLIIFYSFACLLSVSPLECEVHKGRDIILILLYPLYIKQCPAQSRQSIYIYGVNAYNLCIVPKQANIKRLWTYLHVIKPCDMAKT